MKDSIDLGLAVLAVVRNPNERGIMPVHQDADSQLFKVI
jgi:hypothetical protein